MFFLLSMHHHHHRHDTINPPFISNSHVMLEGCLNIPLPPVWSQVINKYGDMYGAERIAELLGLDKSVLDFDPTIETVEKEASLVSW